MATITWAALDACQTPDAIADLLRREGVRGTPRDGHYCPLARATGYVIYTGIARSKSFRGPPRWRRLTDAQNQFIEDVDNGQYPDLIEETEN